MAKKAKKTIAKKKAAGKTARKAAPTPSRAAKSRDEADIIDLILDDHKPLKELIKTLKDLDVGFDEKHEAYLDFAPHLVRHAKPEEDILYSRMKSFDGLRTEAFEGETEHGIADQLVEELKVTDDEDVWMARVRVLAELVEHHIEDEEEEMLPMVRKEIDLEMRKQMAQEFLVAKDEHREEADEAADQREAVQPRL